MRGEIRPYRTKPALVEAVQLLPENAETVARWCGGALAASANALDRTEVFVELNLPTLEGVVRVSQGDYVVKDNGIFRKVDRHTFETNFVDA
jgi:hypothetical protein